MKRQYPVKTVYYSDPLTDEFSGIVREQKTVDETYRYIRRGFFWRLAETVVYGLTVPVAFFYTKLKFGLLIKNRAALRPYRKRGYFLYGNHTQVPGDGFIQAMVSLPKKNKVLVSSENIAVKGTETYLVMVGAMPLPTTPGGYKNFLSALKTMADKGQSFVIYPEAHIWPYYTGIRPFISTSFRYPVLTGQPAFAFTAVYTQRKFRLKPKMTVYVDGPFFPDESLPARAAEKALADEVYAAMLSRSRLSNCDYIAYLPVSCDAPDNQTKEQGEHK